MIMVYGLYAIKDAKVGFLQVMQDTNDNTALRNFAHAVSSPGSLYESNKADFALYKLGTFSTDTGEIVLNDLKILADGASI